MRLWKGALVALMLVMLALVMPAAIVAAADDPLSVAQAFNDARNRGDIAGALALLADDAPVVSGPRCTDASPCIGAAAHRAYLESSAAVHNQVTRLTESVSGMTVQARSEVRNDVVRAAGFERIINNVTVVVQGGKITSSRAVNDLSDPMTAQFVAFMATQPTPPPAGSPVAAAPSPPSAPRTGEGGGADYLRRLGDG